jgi:hypothetical protein
MGYKEMYADKEYCIAELHEARRIFSTKPFTQEKGERLLKGLALMLFYCPEELTTMVEATIYECERRITYVAIGVVKPAPDFDAIAREIEEEAFDSWRFNKSSKQYEGFFDRSECADILRKHFSKED